MKFTSKMTIFLSSVVIATSNPKIEVGNIAVSQSPTQTTITQTSNAGVIQWDTLNVSQGQTLQFQQPSSSSWTLNKVSLSATSIAGNITANGNVIISNPHGIMIHNGAIIDVNSMILTTASLNNEQFLNKDFVFTADAISQQSSIINFGMIETEGPVALMASGIENHGVIVSNLGNVDLAAGGGYRVDLSGRGLFSVSITDELVTKAKDQHGKELKNAIYNSGKIIAKNGAAIISAKAAENVFDTLFAN